MHIYELPRLKGFIIHTFTKKRNRELFNFLYFYLETSKDGQKLQKQRKEASSIDALPVYRFL